MQERLARDGLNRFGDLQDRSEEDLLRRYGPEGQRLYRLAQGIDRRKVTPERGDEKHFRPRRPSTRT